MKKTRLWKTMVTFALSAALLLSATMVFAEAKQTTEDGAGTTPKNAEVTDDYYPLLNFNVENAVYIPVKLLDGKDYAVIDDAAWDLINSKLHSTASYTFSTIPRVSSDTIYSVNWEHSTLQMEDVWESDVHAFWFTRDDSDELILEKCLMVGSISCGKDADGNKMVSSEEGTPWNFFWPENSNMSLQYTLNQEWLSEQERMPDLICIGAWYNPSEYDYGTYYDYISILYIVDKEDMVLHLREVTTLPDNDTPSIEDDTSTTKESYVLDLSDGDAVLSSEDFATLLEENQTKDVVIKSNNNVTFTFKKGTMKAVDGKDSYDFSNTIHNDYSKAAGLPSHVTRDNFIQKIDYNYSGQLPAMASIRFYVGVEYAGKTLYYSQLLNGSSISLVQAVTVDAEGYITIKQDHCSSYIVTTEEIKTEETTATQATQTVPKTGDTSNMVLWIILALASARCALVIRRKLQAS